MPKFRPILAVLLVLMVLWSWQSLQPGTAPQSSAPTQSAPAPTRQAPPSVKPRLPDFLPREAGKTLALIAHGGPYPHRQDGSVFGNRERRLPQRPRGHYREYTVATPGLSHRGPRRIVTGGDPPSEYWYTDDHYETFRRFEVGQ